MVPRMFDLLLKVTLILFFYLLISIGLNAIGWSGLFG
jgi:hypothetical protein